VIPTFYDRGPARLPQRLKASIGSLCHFVNTHRMVSEYTRRFYLNAHDRFAALDANEAARTRARAAWLARVRQGWHDIRIEGVERGTSAAVPAGTAMRVRDGTPGLARA